MYLRQRLNTLPIRSVTRQKYLLSPLFQYSAESSNQCNKARKGNNRHTYQKGRNKTVLICKWHDCLHRKSQGICNQKNLQELIGSSVSEYKISIQKSTELPRTSYEDVNNKIKYIVPFAITQKNEIFRCKLNIHRICMLKTIKCWFKKSEI